MPKHRVLLILPAYNEAGKIGRLVRKTLRFVNRTVVVTDGNTDNTAKEAREAGAVVLEWAERKGVGFAIRAGIDYALDNGYDICVIQGGDDQDDPREIPRLLSKMDEGYDFVIGSRYLPGGVQKRIPLFRLVTTKLYTLFFSLLSGHKTTDASNGFRAFRTSVTKNMGLWRHDLDGYELEHCMLWEAVKNYKYVEVPVTKTYHIEEGYSKMRPVIDWWTTIKPALKKFFGAYGLNVPRRRME